MTTGDSLLRVALEERMAFGPRSRIPIAERVREREPDASPAEIDAALQVARTAVDSAAALATEGMRGERSEGDIREELARRFPWLRPAEDVLTPRWWPRFLPVLRRDDLAQRLKNFGYYLMK